MSVTFLNLRFELSDSIKPIKEITYTGMIWCAFVLIVYLVGGVTLSCSWRDFTRSSYITGKSK